jgi:hypothetical protein
MKRSLLTDDIIKTFSIKTLISIRIDFKIDFKKNVSKRNTSSVKKNNADSSNIRKMSEKKQNENSIVVFSSVFINTSLNTRERIYHLLNQKKILIMILIWSTSLIVELGFEQKFKPDSRVEQIRQPNPRVELPEPEETELVTYKFLGLGQKPLSKLESWTEILVQPEDWIGSDCSSCPKSNSAATLWSTKWKH